MRSLLILSGLFAMLLFSCKKEELVITEVPLELDENTEEYQQYIAERALEFIKTYRLEKVDSLIKKLTNEKEKKRITDSFIVYKQRAISDAFYFVTDKNDSLFFLHPGIKNEKELTNLIMNFVGQPPFSGSLFNTKGVLHGFRRFPELIELTIENSLGTGIEELEYADDLQTFTWSVDRGVMEQQFPQQAFEYVALKADFSKNTKLQSLRFRNISDRNLIFPDHQLNAVVFEQSDINATNNLNTLKTKTLQLLSDKASSPGFVLKNDQIENLRIEASSNLGEIYSGNIKTVDISETKLKSFIVRDATSIEKITLNEGLENLDFEILEYGDREFAGKLAEISHYPNSLQNLKLVSRQLKQQDFSNLDQLQTMQLSGQQQDYQITVPSSLKTLYVFNANECNLNLENATALEAVSVSAHSTVNLGKLPASVHTLNLINAGNNNSTLESLDLSASQLNNLSINKFSLSQIKFPSRMNSLSLGGGTALPADIIFPAELYALHLSELPELSGSIQFPSVVSEVKISDIRSVYSNMRFNTALANLDINGVENMTAVLTVGDGLSMVNLNNITAIGGIILPETVNYLMLSDIGKIAAPPVLPTSAQSIAIRNVAGMPARLSFAGFWSISIEQAAGLTTLDLSAHTDLAMAFSQITINENPDLREIIFPINYWESINVLVANDYGDVYENLTPDMQARCEDGLFRQLFDITVKKDCKLTNLPEAVKKYIQYIN